MGVRLVTASIVPPDELVQGQIIDLLASARKTVEELLGHQTLEIEVLYLLEFGVQRVELGVQALDLFGEKVVFRDEFQNAFGRVLLTLDVDLHVALHVLQLAAVTGEPTSASYASASLSFS